MKTRITTKIELAAQTLNNGGIIGLPTETVYGLGGIAYKEQAVQEIYRVKQRPYYNPLILHIGSADYLDTIASMIPQAAYDLAEEFWPGPMTLVLPKRQGIPDIVSAHLATVAIRVPGHPVARQLLAAVAGPIAAPSANPFGRVSPTTALHVRDYFEGKIPLILDGGPCRVGIESTIVGFENGQAVIYRQGWVTEEQVRKVAGNVGRLKHDNSPPKAPGMLSRHYSPKTPLVVAKHPFLAAAAYPGKRIGIISFTEADGMNTFPQVILSQRGSLEEAAANLYSTIHTMDEQAFDLIIAQEVPQTGIGAAINDKLYRAAKR